jgi:hypothetical protein
MKVILASALVLGGAIAVGLKPQEHPAAAALPLGANSMLLPGVPEERDLVSAEQTLDRFHEAAAKADFDAYFAAWTEDSVFLGTDATERWVGQQFKDFAKPIFDKGKGWTYHPHDRHVTHGPANTVYFDELLDNEKLGLCRGSGVLAKLGEEWKILQYNLSIPVPNDLAASVAEVIRKGAPAKPATPPPLDRAK